MNDAVRAWLFMQLGKNTDVADLTARYTRLGSARAVALEVLGERLAAFQESPGTVSVSGVVSVSFVENIKSLERKIESLRSGEPPAPDDPDDEDDTDGGGFGVIQLIARPRR